MKKIITTAFAATILLFGASPGQVSASVDCPPESDDWEDLLSPEDLAVCEEFLDTGEGDVYPVVLPETAPAPTQAPPTTAAPPQPAPTVPPGGLPATGSSGASGMMQIGGLLLVGGFIVFAAARRRIPAPSA